MAKLKIFFWRLFLVGWVLAVLAFTILVFTLPDVRPLAKENPREVSFMKWRQKELLSKGKKPIIRQTFVPYRNISPHLKNAVRYGEDLNFFRHSGFDFYEIKQAIKKALAKKEFPRGASTITMQTARLIYLTPSQSPIRKIREAFITISLEAHLSKERILELYLNYSDWGNGIFGAEEAARRYFGKSASALDCFESAALTAMLPAPNARDPNAPNRNMRKQMRIIQRRMGCRDLTEEK